MKDPVTASVCSLIVVFSITIFVLWLVKPNFVLKQKMNGDREVQWDKLAAYSAIVGIVVAVGVLLVMENTSKRRRSKNFGASRSQFALI